MRISFVVPLFNHLQETQAMLASLWATLPPGLEHEVILVDDGSTDGTRDWLRSLQDSRVKPVLNSTNLGFAAANNAGVMHATGEVLGLLNNDLLLQPGWLAPMLDVLLNEHLHAGIVGNLQYRVVDQRLDHAGVRINPNAQLEHIQQEPAAHKPWSKAMAVTGACVLMRRADYLAHGGFDEAYLNGGEDVDLCFKLRAAGLHIYVAHHSRVLHHVSLSRSRTSLQNLRNSQLLFKRWRPVLKRTLSDRWFDMLKCGPETYAQWLPCELSEGFLSTPRLASLVITDHMLHREEHHWSRLLGQLPASTLGLVCKARGLRREAGRLVVTPGVPVEFELTGIQSLRNFYVCGHTELSMQCQPVIVALVANGVQQIRQPLSHGHGVNIGLSYPLTLSSEYNRFQLMLQLKAGTKSASVANAPIMTLSHLVVDDQQVIPSLI